MFGPKVRDQQFFDAFTQHSALSVDAAKELHSLFSYLADKDGNYLAPPADGAPDEKTREIAKRIKISESAGDKITHDTVRHLHATWITPIDRDDIHLLVSRLDDVLDLAEAVSERVVLFNIVAAPKDAILMTEVLMRGCGLMHKAMIGMQNLKDGTALLDLCVELHQVENEADKIYRHAIADLFKPGNDPLMVMKWRDLFDNLEFATDRCEDVANIVEGLVLDYA
ncbi:MAG: DUF47 domain-containing protein [Polyangiaceae bacterium]|nr:DUF47 domain-containing protein [Polyangiaceae bacterium]